MNIVIPMAGYGSRFVNAGFRDPKPIISIDEKPMYSYAVASLPLELASALIFVCLEEHLQNTALETDIRSRYPEHTVHIVSVNDVLPGQACSVLAARSHIDSNTPLLIYNADTYFSSSLADTLRTIPADAAGVVSVFEASGSQWSFAKVIDGQIVELAEKNPISSWATTGMYYFAHGSDFVRTADAAIRAEESIRGEYYVAPLYNKLIAEGKSVLPDYADTVTCFGTPEALEIAKNEGAFASIG